MPDCGNIFSLFPTVADAAFFMGINVSSPYVLC